MGLTISWFLHFCLDLATYWHVYKCCGTHLLIARTCSIDWKHRVYVIFQPNKLTNLHINFYLIHTSSRVVTIFSDFTRHDSNNCSISEIIHSIMQSQFRISNYTDLLFMPHSYQLLVSVFFENAGYRITISWCVSKRVSLLIWIFTLLKSKV